MPAVDELSESVAVPVPPEAMETVAGLGDAVRLPEDGTAVSVTVPLNPPRLVMVRVEVEDDVAMKLTVVGLAVRL